MKVLVVEDHRILREAVVQALEEEGYQVTSTDDGEEGLWYAREFLFEVIILDLMLPSLDGMEILKRIRLDGNPVNILILTAKDSVADRVKGLDSGADDYLVKPFAISELISRVNALIRRNTPDKNNIVRISDLVINLKERTASRNGQHLDLSAREFNLLELLAVNRGKIISREAIWDRLCDFASDINSNLIDVYVSNLRKKLEEQSSRRIIFTRRGVGYYLEDKG